MKNLLLFTLLTFGILPSLSLADRSFLIDEDCSHWVNQVTLATVEGEKTYAGDYGL